ncbi:MAG: hypothetical protein GTO12_13800 [Proteobacteria bacterium]|nr:hypothetical protein [Pseudomonadota bacterium]
MKVTQAIDYWMEYHKLHSKKHYSNLRVHDVKLPRQIRRQRFNLCNPR